MFTVVTIKTTVALLLFLLLLLPHAATIFDGCDCGILRNYEPQGAARDQLHECLARHAPPITKLMPLSSSVAEDQDVVGQVSPH